MYTDICLGLDWLTLSTETKLICVKHEIPQIHILEMTEKGYHEHVTTCHHLHTSFICHEFSSTSFCPNKINSFVVHINKFIMKSVELNPNTANLH